MYPDTTITVRVEAYERERQGYDQALAGIQAEGHWPASLRVQLDAGGSALLNVHTKRTGFREQAWASAAWIVADRWVVSGQLAHDRTVDARRNGPMYLDGWNVGASFGATYFLADHLNAHASFNQAWAKYQNANPYFDPAATHARAGGFLLGLTYRFAGFASIPALSPFMTN